MPPAAIAVAGLVVSAAGVITSVSQSRKARKSQREIGAQQEATNTITARQSRQRAAREARVKRAVALQGAENIGISGGSAVGGSISNLSSGIAAQSAQQAFQSRAAEGLSRTQQQLADVNSRIQTSNAIGNLGSSVFSATAGSLFSTTPKTT